jgi:ribose transport system permease protein
VSFLLLLAVAAAAWLAIARTRFGHHLIAVGGDPEVARLSGVRNHRVLVTAHVLCSLCAGLAGIYLASRLGSGAPRVGTEGLYDLESIAAVVLGGTALAGGRGGVAGTVGGVLLLASIDAIFNQLEVDAFFKQVIRGLIIIAAVAIYARRALRKAAS